MTSDPTVTPKAEAAKAKAKNAGSLGSYIALAVALWLAHWVGYYGLSGPPLGWLTIVTIVGLVLATKWFREGHKVRDIVALAVVALAWLIARLGMPGLPNLEVGGGIIALAIAVAILAITGFSLVMAYKVAQKRDWI